jgi:hypothetical protein
MAARKAISLSAEVHLLASAVDCAKDSSDRIANGESDTAVREAKSVAAVLTIVRDRLLLLDRIARGSADARLLWSEENAGEASTSVADGERDVLLRAWTNRREARTHRRLWKMAKRRGLRERPRQPNLWVSHAGSGRSPRLW